MLCSRPVTRVPYTEAFDSQMQLRYDGRWTCSCGTVVQLTKHRQVPSHRVPEPDPDKVTVQTTLDRITELFITLAPATMDRMIAKLINIRSKRVISHKTPVIARRGMPRYYVQSKPVDYEAILFNRPASEQ